MIIKIIKIIYNFIKKALILLEKINSYSNLIFLSYICSHYKINFSENEIRMKMMNDDILKSN